MTFLTDSLIQNTQNRDSRAVHITLDEIIQALERTDDRIMSAEKNTDEELEELQRTYDSLRAR